MKIKEDSRKALLDQYQFICHLISAPSVFCRPAFDNGVETVSLCFLMRKITEGLSALGKVSCCVFDYMYLKVRGQPLSTM